MPRLVELICTPQFAVTKFWYSYLVLDNVFTTAEIISKQYDYYRKKVSC